MATIRRRLEHLEPDRPSSRCGRPAGVAAQQPGRGGAGTEEDPLAGVPLPPVVTYGRRRRLDDLPPRQPHVARPRGQVRTEGVHRRARLYHAVSLAKKACDDPLGNRSTHLTNRRPVEALPLPQTGVAPLASLLHQGKLPFIALPCPGELAGCPRMQVRSSATPSTAGTSVELLL
jgi:hypothetical protein